MVAIESRHDRFVRLAEKRTQRAIDAIRLIGNLSHRSNYEFSEAEVRKIMKALEEELRLTRERFSKAGDTRMGFKLK